MTARTRTPGRTGTDRTSGSRRTPAPSTRAGLTGLAVAALALSGCAATVGGGGSSAEGPSGGGSGGADGPVTLRFQSLAFQEPTIAATEAIVDAWNADNPDVQVEYVQGSWDSVQDQLVTQFAGGTAPDIIQYESAAIGSFAAQGYLADLTDLLPDDVRESVSEDVWQTVTVDEQVVAVPTLLQSYVVFANTDLLEQAGVEVPTGDSWSWDEFAEAARATTSGEVTGVGWGLANPTATVMSMGLGFDAEYFEGTGADASISVDDAELEVPRRIHDMAWTDGSVDTVSLTQSGGDVLPGFLAGEYAMTVQGSYVAQTITETAPDGFSWAVLPPLAGSDAEQSANPQTLSVSADSVDVEAAAEFLAFYMQAGNLAEVAQGDWLIPASAEAADVVAEQAGDGAGWPQVLASGEVLVEAPFQKVDAYPRWKDQVATPALQEYLADRITLEELRTRLTEGFAEVAAG